MSIALTQKIAHMGNIDYLKMVDAWNWAYYSQIKLVGGHFQLSNHEHQIEPLQDESQIQVFQKSAQTVGGTEIYVLRSLHALIHKRYPKGILYLFPNKDVVTDFSASRFKPLIADNYETIGKYVQETDRANLKRIHDAFNFFRSGRISVDDNISDQSRISPQLFSKIRR